MRQVQEREFFLPKYFFVTGGKGVSSESALNAFDLALMDAKIDHCNIVNVTSIIPADAEEVSIVNIPPGTITFAVLARMDGQSGETVGAGIGWCWGRKPDGTRYGTVSEAHGYKDRGAIERELKAKLHLMAKIRQLTTEEVKLRIESIDVPKGKFGCVVAVFVYVPFGQGI